MLILIILQRPSHVWKPKFYLSNKVLTFCNKGGKFSSKILSTFIGSYVPKYVRALLVHLNLTFCFNCVIDICDTLTPIASDLLKLIRRFEREPYYSNSLIKFWIEINGSVRVNI